MAEDTLCLLNYLQWTEDRSLHIVGMSLGGMIAQGIFISLHLRGGTSNSLSRTRIPDPRSNHIAEPHCHTRWWKRLGQYAFSMCAYRKFCDRKE